MIALGIGLSLAGVAMVCRPMPAILAPGRTSSGDAPVERRGPRVFVEFRAAHVRDRDRQQLSVNSVLHGAGYRVRARPEFITRDGLEGNRVLVVDRSVDALGDWRTAALVNRWIDDGGALLILAAGQPGPARVRQGAGRVAALDPTVLTPRAFIMDLLDAMRWLEPSAVGVAEVNIPR